MSETLAPTTETRPEQESCDTISTQRKMFSYVLCAECMQIHRYYYDYTSQRALRTVLTNHLCIGCGKRIKEEPCNA